MFDDVARAVAGVVVGRVERDAEVAVNGGCQVARCDWAFGRVSAVLFGRADHLTVSQAAAGHAHGHDGWPVIAAVRAALSAHDRRSAELAHRNHQAVVEQSTFAEVADESRQ